MTSLAQTAEPTARAGDLRRWLFVVAVFASASLVFMVEPLIGKLFLPSLGGSPAIWNTTLAFFQAALLAGYAYAHLLQKLGPVRRQVAIHLGVLVLAGLVLPLHPSGLLGEPWEGAPAVWLALVLALTVGGPFAVLSATAPLLQAWYARFAPPESQGRDVYGLYAASNLGSLLALAAYPILIEPLMGLRLQSMSWSLAYGAFGVLLAGLALGVRRTPELAKAAAGEGAAESAPTWADRAAWVLLAAAPSSLLVGVTSHLTADVASTPFLWVIPLELYLLTFVIAFRQGAKPPSTALMVIQTLAVAAAVLLLADPNFPWIQQFGVHLGAFFITALVCHKTLVERRPAPAHLTEFYLLMSLGGVLGGGFNAFLAPMLFDVVWEYPIVLALSCLARPWGFRRWTIRDVGFLIAGLVWIIPLFLTTIVVPPILRTSLALAPIVMAVILTRRGIAVAVLLGALAIAAELQGFGRYDSHHRSFFGVTHLNTIQVEGGGPMRIMVHGTTLHGAQMLDPARHCQPTTYYAPPTAIGTVFRMEQAAKPALEIGAVGLGSGTVATYVRDADRMRFYEIDPLVARLSLDPSVFSFVKTCAKGPVDVVIGDARLSLAKEPTGKFDLLLVDAFSSDSVPTHLLTVEALNEYLRVVKPDGIVLLHLSNRNLELTGPASAAAKAARAASIMGQYWSPEGVSPYVETGGVVLAVSRDVPALERYVAIPGWGKATLSRRAWSDDYTNVWGAMVARFREGRR